jgi:hypothetical protein
LIEIQHLLHYRHLMNVRNGKNEMLICIDQTIARNGQSLGIFIGFGSPRAFGLPGCVLARAFVSRLA